LAKDTRPYIVVANELFGHPKFKKLTPPARLYVLELWAHCNQYMTDGAVDKDTLYARGKQVAEQILATGWAHPDGDDFQMHDYLKHQKSRQEIEEHKLKKRMAGIKSNHTRNHVAKEQVDPNCILCVEQ
jgi:hypothetical protein